MLRLVTDADFNGRVYKALRRRIPELDIVRVQDVGLRTGSDAEILAWAAAEGRILLSHDRETMTTFAYDRVRAGLPMPGLFIIRDLKEQIGAMVEALLLVIHCSEQHEWQDQVQFLPI